MSKLTLQVKGQPDKTVVVGNMVMTPAIDEDYWLYRVELSDKQAIVGFPKFSTIGIGFQVEDDWNTNLPYTSSAEDIYEHIKHNKADKRIRKPDCITAIRMIQEAAAQSRTGR